MRKHPIRTAQAHPHSSLPTSRAGWLSGALICSAVAAAIFFSFFSRKELLSDFREHVGSSSQSPATSAKGVRERASTHNRLDRNTKAALIASPLTAEGVNDYANDYFKLDQDDVNHINELLVVTR